MSNIKYRQLVDGSWHYWGYIDGCFVGPITNQEPNPINCQFTGLHDVNGVEIWQGDIVRLWNGNKTFVGHDGFQFTTTKRLKPVSRQMLSDCSVIGNIYQHPELLEPKP